MIEAAGGVLIAIIVKATWDAVARRTGRARSRIDRVLHQVEDVLPRQADETNRRLAGVDARLDAGEQRMGRIEEKLDKVETLAEGTDATMRAHIDEEERKGVERDRRIDDLTAAILQGRRVGRAEGIDP